MVHVRPIVLLTVINDAVAELEGEGLLKVRCSGRCYKVHDFWVESRHNQIISQQFSLDGGLTHLEVDILQDGQGVNWVPVIELATDPMGVELPWEQMLLA